MDGMRLYTPDIMHELLYPRVRDAGHNLHCVVEQMTVEMLRVA
jgi:hypothetical protein